MDFKDKGAMHVLENSGTETPPFQTAETHPFQTSFKKNLKRDGMQTQQGPYRVKVPAESLHSHLGDEGLFGNLVADNLSSAQTPLPKKTKLLTTSPIDAFIKKRVVSQLSAQRNSILTTPNLIVRTGITNELLKKRKQIADETDFISLNKKMQTFSRTIGKEANIRGI